MSSTEKIRFERAGIYLSGLILLALGGFWESYFSRFFGPMQDLNPYFHFHAFLAGSWIVLLIVQPYLIRKKNFALHKKLGKLSFLIIPLFIVSVVLLFHSQRSLDEEQLGRRMLTPLRDLIIIATAYIIAIKYRKSMPIHARAMIATGIVFIEPALVRLIWNLTHFRFTYLLAILMIYGLLASLMIIERKQKEGRWVFPLITILYLIGHSIRIGGIQLDFLDNLAKWFLQLPLT